MKRKKDNSDQLLLLEKRQRWNDVPQETRQQVVGYLASLLIERLTSSSARSNQEQSHVSTR